MRQGVRLRGVWLKRLLSMTILQIVEVGVVEPRQVALDVVECLQAFGYLVPWGAVGEELPQLGEHGAVCVVHARLVGCDAILLRLAQFRDDHAREQAVEPFRQGEQVGVAPDADEVAAMLAQRMAVGMAHDDLVELGARVVLAVKQSPVGPMAEQQDGFAQGRMAQQVLHVAMRAIGGDHLCFEAFVKHLEHSGRPVVWMHYQHHSTFIPFPFNISPPASPFLQRYRSWPMAGLTPRFFPRVPRSVATASRRRRSAGCCRPYGNS